MTRKEAKQILFSMTNGDSLLRHARSVELVMEGYAERLNQNTEDWAIAGMLHDADYEAYPDEHPKRIVKLLEEKNEFEIAHAISAHYTKWNVPYNTLLDKALLACDELTGFIIACCHVRPEGINGLTPKSVKKKLKQKSFAAKVERDEIEKGCELINIEITTHIQNIIETLNLHKDELQIG